MQVRVSGQRDPDRNKLKSLFLCGSVVINVESSAPNKEFFEHQLLPGVHYVSVRDSSDVPAAVREMEENMRRAKSIAAAGTRRMAAFNADAVYDYVATALTEYASRMTFKPERSPGSFEVSCEDDLYRHYDHDGVCAVPDGGQLRRVWTSRRREDDHCDRRSGLGRVVRPGRGTHPCEVANDVKEVPDKCPVCVGVGQAVREGGVRRVDAGRDVRGRNGPDDDRPSRARFGR